MDFTFTPDDQLQYAAQRYAENAVDNAAKLGVSLDFSLESVKGVEQVLGQLHERASSYSDEEISILARQFGSYLGEVLLRLTSGDWGIVQMSSGDRVAGIHLLDRDITLWPWAKAHKRITQGAADDVWTYVQALLAPQAG